MGFVNPTVRISSHTLDSSPVTLAAHKIGSEHNTTRWLQTIEVFNKQGKVQHLKLFPSQVEAPSDDPQVARVLLNNVRLERTRQFGACYLGLELWKGLELHRFDPHFELVPHTPRL